jgi:hypothetical protein
VAAGDSGDDVPLRGRGARELPLREERDVKCFGCQRNLEVGDLYIEDTASGFSDQDANVEVDGLIAELFGGHGDKVIFCED